MPTLMKVFYSMLLMLVCQAASAQHTYMTVGANLVLPTESGLKKDAGTGFGGSVGVETTIGKKINGTASVGYTSFADVETSDRVSNFKAIPIQLGMKYYALAKAFESTGLFFSADFGMMPTSVKFKFKNGDPDYKNSNLSFTIAPGVGYQAGPAEVSIKPLFNLSETGSKVYYVDFRIAYRFF
ncbi:MAG TPA: outer membrane beta-barrel protein [Flavitalea sp.]|nr:outer membrane beta-barrel protein [Flavitalea sp.]